MVRKPVFAGSFYPRDSSLLSGTIDQYLNQAEVKVEEEIFGLVSPHAGYDYSGLVAAFGYKALKGKNKKLVILLGPSHRYYVKGFSVYGGGKWETPLGVVEIDNDFASRIVSQSKLIINEPEAHSQEHSLEVQIPFLQKILNRDFKIVPIVFNTEENSKLKELVNALAKELEGREDWIIIASSDLYHGYDYEEAKAVTERVNNYIERLDYRGLLEYDRLKREESTCAACGCSSIAVLLQVMEKLGMKKVKLLAKTTSGDVTGEKKGYVVGYGSWAFLKEKKGEEESKELESLGFNLTLEDKKILLDIARKTIDEYVKNNKVLEVTVKSEVLKRPCGAFVTLKKKGNLRGCIGRIVADEPLYLVVRDMAIASATEDPRFPPLEVSELKDIKIEISVLTPMQKVNNVDEIEVGRDGLMIRKGFRSGLLLPQVPVEQGWDKKTFLEHTCYKAGLPSDAWKTSELWKFQAIVFSED
ncbi:MAG: AmmeMemoRadiSam system protein B [candidate division WOR-3 bacterium]